MDFLMPDTNIKDLTGPSGIISGGDDSGIGGDTTDLETFYFNYLQQQISDPNKPLGTGFLKEYEVPIFNADGTPKLLEGSQVIEVIPAEEFLTSDEYQKQRRDIFGSGEAFRNVYFQRDIANQFRSLSPTDRIKIKNLLADAGLMDLSKTYGDAFDSETSKAIKLAMDFSMNNLGKMSWVNSAKTMGDYAKANQAIKTTDYELTEEVLNDLVKDVLKQAEDRKGKPLSEYEKNYITNQIMGGPVEGFKESLTTLTPATPDQLVMDEATGMTTLIPGTEAQEPDVDILTEGANEVLDNVFAPREELAAESELEDDTFYRIQRNLAGFESAQRDRAPRR
jgi:hypothetical protein